jgi:hypothetical protein
LGVTRTERPVALVFEIYGGVCFFSLIGFLVLASVAKLRPDLDEEGLDLVELEKLKQLVHQPERSDGPVSLEPPILEEAFWSPPARPVKQSKRLIRKRPHLISLRSGGIRP